MKLPKSTDIEIKARDEATILANRRSINVPLSTLREVANVWGYLHKAARIGNMNCKSDIQVSVLYYADDPPQILLMTTPPTKTTW